ncbi:MAG: adenylate/guanylate cyclase domain-containing protein [Thermodesulfobacteria bacterium]|nr:adenylate/guanylate cyclase domain-containing protein [Thermodesulfobacteriota bacterium]
MKRSTTKQGMSFYRKIRISLALMGILPFLLVIYLFIEQHISLSNTLILCAGLILFSILVGFILLRESADQISTLAEVTTLPESPQELKPIELSIDGELENIACNFNAMIEQLNQARHDVQEQSIQLLKYADDLARSYEQLKKEEQLRTHLSRYIGNELVEQIMACEHEVLLPNERKQLTIMFADIRSFTTLAEKMSPEKVVTMLNRYFSVMVEIIFSCNGMLDKFVGDQIMAVFGHLSDEKQGARDAVLAALKMQRAMKNLQQTLKEEGLPVFQIGIGINTGKAIIGSVGSKNRQDYTVIGDAVNTAARLEEQAGPGEIIIGEQTYNHLPDSIQVKNRLSLSVRNRTEPVICYTIHSPLEDSAYIQKTIAAQQHCSSHPSTISE